MSVPSVSVAGMLGHGVGSMGRGAVGMGHGVQVVFISFKMKLERKAGN